MSQRSGVAARQRRVVTSVDVLRHVHRELAVARAAMLRDVHTHSGARRRCYKRLSAVRQHQRNTQARALPGGGYTVRVNGTACTRQLPGVHASLRRRFYPHGARHQARVSHARASCSRHGAAHGARVHLEVQRYTEHGTRPHFECARWVRECLGGELDVCTVRVLDLCARRGWLPVRSEWVVYDHALRVCTAIDLVVLDTHHHRLLALELKTGYEGAEFAREVPRTDGSNARLAPPFDAHADSALHRAALQLATTMAMCHHRYSVTFDAGYVVHVCPHRGETLLWELPSWLRTTAQQRVLYDALRQRPAAG